MPGLQGAVRGGCRREFTSGIVIREGHRVCLLWKDILNRTFSTSLEMFYRLHKDDMSSPPHSPWPSEVPYSTLQQPGRAPPCVHHTARLHLTLLKNLLIHINAANQLCQVTIS